MDSFYIFSTYLLLFFVILFMGIIINIYIHIKKTTITKKNNIRNANKSFCNIYN